MSEFSATILQPVRERERERGTLTTEDKRRSKISARSAFIKRRSEDNRRQGGASQADEETRKRTSKQVSREKIGGESEKNENQIMKIYKEV